MRQGPSLRRSSPGERAVSIAVSADTERSVRATGLKVRVMTVLADSVEIDLGPLRLKGLLGVPPDATALVIFAHGSGSSRLSPRNNRVAAALRGGGLATLLLDLLTPEEENDRANVFDIALLAS